MTDILYEAALEYQKLKNWIYNIILGRKGDAYYINLHFPPEAFFHLAGLQHLSDLTFPSSNKERIYKEILRKKFTLKHIKKSVFYEEYHIEERIAYLRFLVLMIEFNSIYYRVNKKNI